LECKHDLFSRDGTLMGGRSLAVLLLAQEADEQEFSA
jgi:hypothetical protein